MVTSLDVINNYTSLKNYDYAVPEDWADKLRKLQIGTSYYVWSYDEAGIFGKPVHILEAAARKLLAQRHWEYVTKRIEELVNRNPERMDDAMLEEINELLRITRSIIQKEVGDG